MQMITHSHRPYGICQVDIHSCKAPTFIEREAFFFLQSRVWGVMTYQMRWPLCHQDSPLNPQKSLVFDFNNEEPPLTHTQEHS